MAMFEHANRAPLGARTVYKTVEMIERIIDEARIAIKARRVHAALNRMSRRELADIGLGERDLDTQSREIARRTR